jgi:hypothetical protein
MKKLVAAAFVIILGAIGAYTRGTSIWESKEQVRNLITPEDRAKGAILPVMDLYDYLVNKVAYQKTDVIQMDFNQRAQVPNQDTSPNKKFSIQIKDANILPLKDNQSGKKYLLQLPSQYGDIMNTAFSADSSILVLCLMATPMYYISGFSTQYNPVYDASLGNKSFLPALFQIKRNSISAWIKDDHVIVWEKQPVTWGEDKDNLHYYSLPMLNELYHLFTDATNIALLQLIQKARTTKNPVNLKPDELKLFNSFKKEIQDALKPFITIGGPLAPR